ncbi:MAG: hypothetical protein KGL39_42945 [Patescibacteria group bacterium]|nr:hypothetical protein [Patescibacteria group bacterium]
MAQQTMVDVVTHQEEIRLDRSANCGCRWSSQSYGDDCPNHGCSGEPGDEPTAVLIMGDSDQAQQQEALTGLILVGLAQSRALARMTGMDVSRETDQALWREAEALARHR